MRGAPDIDHDAIAHTLRERFGVDPNSIEHLPLGHDVEAAVYRVESANHGVLFAKVRTGAAPAGLAMARALVDRGIPNILAPIPTCSGRVAAPLHAQPDRTVVLFPFIDGDSAMERGLTPDQWRRFGTTLRAVHDCNLPPDIQRDLPVTDGTLPSAGIVRDISDRARSGTFTDSVAQEFAAFWRTNQVLIDRILRRATCLGQAIAQSRSDLIPCHADIHAANILVGDNDAIWLVDWDDPRLASPERDLFFVIGSRIARPVTPNDEIDFFEGYGTVSIDAKALVFYRYERIIDDLAEFGQRILEGSEGDTASRAYEADLARSLFAPGADIDRAEIVDPASSLVSIR